MDDILEFKDEHRWLSNFYPVHVKWEGLLFPSVEHAYQAAKSPDPGIRQRFQGGHPARAKRLGRDLPARHDWGAVKLDVMGKLLDQKFTYPDLRKKLMDTHPVQLIHGNWWDDTYWGVNHWGQGFNHLGELIMKIRLNLVTKGTVR